MSPIHEHNRRAWDDRVRKRKWYIDTATDQDFQEPLKVIDPRGWLGDVTGKRVLCLAAGGGRHGVLLAAVGARVTVVDLSPEMLALDREAAAKRGLSVELAEGSMDDLSMLSEASFDLVIQPVSTCYVPDVLAVYREVARVIVPGGIYVSQHKQPASLQTDYDSGTRRYWLAQPYYREGALPPAPEESWHREAGAAEFLHRWEELLGGLCRCGFVIVDVHEPRRGNPQSAPGSPGHRSCFAAPYVALKARRIDPADDGQGITRLWQPGL